jgi:hypothetical protein
MPQPRKYNWLQFMQTAVPALSSLDSPHLQAEAAEQDLHPGNIQELDAAIRDPRHRGAAQQQTLLNEKARIEQMQAQQMQQQIQGLPQRLGQRLDLKAKVGETPPEHMMVKILAQMARRYRMPRQQIGGEQPQVPNGPSY